MLSRDINPVDKLLIQADAALRTIFGNPPLSGRPNPAENLAEAELNELERKHTAGLMRVNHSGEVSAQGLYQGQALTARLPRVREKMEQAAIEGVEMLADNPQLGILRSELGRGLYLWPHESHLIFYRFDDDAIEIGRILHSSMDVVLHLSTDPSVTPSK